MSNKLRRLMLIITAVSALIMLLGTAHVFAAETFLNSTDDITVTTNNEYQLIDGVFEGDLTLTKAGGASVKASVILIKPNAKAKIQPVIPGYFTSGSTKASRSAALANWGNSSFSTAGLTRMAQQYESAADTTAGSVIAAVNGDFGTGTTGNAPRGSVILEGNKELKHSNAFSDEFYFGYKDGIINIVQRAQGQQDEFTDAITGPMFILRNGSLFGVDNENDSRERTGVAYKTNGEVLLITVYASDRPTNSSGISVKQLAQLMKASGCWNGINMDGGGSTTFLSKRSGENLTRKSADITSGYSQDENGERLIQSGILLVADNDAVANKVTANNTLTTDKDTYSAGQPIKVTASSSYDGAWVSLIKASDPYTAASYFWYYTYGVNDAGTWCWGNSATVDICTDGVCSNREDVTSGWALTPGQYKVVLLKGNYEKIAEKQITITEAVPPTDPYHLETEKTVYNAGEEIWFKATAPITNTWVGIFLRNDTIPGDISFYYYTLTPAFQNRWNCINRAGQNVTPQQRPGHALGAELAPGEYKLVLFHSYDGDTAYTEEESVNITIVDQTATYSITYKDGDKTLTGLSPASYTYSDVENDSLSLPTTVEKDGHEFIGWYLDSDLSGTPVTSIPKGSSGDKTYYAKFEQNEFEVTFNTDGGSLVPAQTVKYGELAVRPSEDPNKENFRFIDWVTEKDGNTAFNFSAGIKSDTTIYAKWGSLDNFIVSFDTDGGSNVAAQEVAPGGKASVPAAPTKKGYEFDKWVTEKDGDTEFYFNTEINADTIVYAKWNRIKYTITYDFNGGNSVVNPTEYYVDSETILLNSPTKEGALFGGWIDAEGKIVVSIPKGSTGDLVLTATWLEYLSADRTTCKEGESIKVVANYNDEAAWVGLYPKDAPRGEGGVESYRWYYVKDHNGKEIDIINGKEAYVEKYGFIPAGDYELFLFGDDGYDNIVKKIDIIIEPDGTKGIINIKGYSRSDKTYNGAVSSRHGDPLYEYFYGDGIIASATVTGDGANDAWVGVMTDDGYYTGGSGVYFEHNWYYIDDFKGQDVNLNYVYDSQISEDAQALPYGLNYWLVLFSGTGKILDAEPFNYRTYNMDWNVDSWNADERKAVKENIKVDMEWNTKVADGTDQKPEVKLTRINGHFGFEKNESGEFKKDSNGNLIEITEQEIKEGEEYTLFYPSESINPGSYNIQVEFPYNEQGKVDGLNYLREERYKENYGFKDGLTYRLTSTENDSFITYMLNEGINDDRNPLVYTPGTEIKLYAATRPGYIFGGWYTTSDFEEGTMIEAIPASAEGDIILYAKWISDEDAKYKITYVLNGGENDVSNPIGYNGDIEISIKPAKRPGYIFEGWFFDPEFTKPADTIAKGMTGDITLYAKFTKASADRFKITTEVIGGSISGNKVVKAGESITVSYEPAEGNVLESIDVDGTLVNTKTYRDSFTFRNVSKDHTIKVTYVDPSEGSLADGEEVKVGSVRYKVISSKKKTVKLVKAKNTKKFTVPAAIKVKGRKYKVTTINAKAFTGKKIRTVIIGKNVKKIAKYAFKSSKATKMIVKTKKLTKKSVKGSLKKSKIKKIQVKVGKKSVNKKYLKKYKKIFTKKNAGKKAKIK